MEGRSPTIHGDGGQTRDFTFVTNVVDGVLRASQATTDVSGKVINVATDSRISLNDLFGTLKAITGATVDPVYGPTRAGDVRDSLADITRARDLLGYTPIVGLEEGLRQTVAWYMSTRPTA